MEIIPAEQFCRIRMNFSGGNHPCTEISSKQDAFLRWESSLHRNFFKSGCNSQAEIIPAQKFLQIRMQFPGGNHPCRAILSNQDEFLRRKSSPHRNFFEKGCNSPAGIKQTSYSARKWCQPYQECRRLHHDFRYWLGVIPSTFLKIREK